MKSLFFLLFWLGSLTPQLTAQEASQGILDLRGHDWKQEPGILLNGEWEIYWMSFWTPPESPSKSPTGFILQPGLWNTTNTSTSTVGGNTFPPHGYATLKLTLLLDESAPEGLGFILETISTTYKLWVNDRLLVQMGTPGETKATTIPKIANRMVTMERHGETKLEVLLQVSNFVDREGGRRKRLELGSADYIQYQWNLEFILESMFVATLLVVGIYHLILFFLRKSETYALSFGLMTILFALRTSFDNGRVFSFLVPHLDFEIFGRIWFMEYYFMPVSVVFFISTLFPQETKSWILKIGLGVAVAFSVFLFATDYSLGILSLSFYHFNTLFLIIMAFWTLFKAIKAKRSGAILFLTSTLILVTAGVNDILYTENIIQTFFMSTMGLLGFVFCQVYLIAARFSHAFLQIEALSQELKDHNKTLEKVVSKRTRRLRQQNHKVFESIKYARIIQSSVLPSDEFLRENLGPILKIWKPKDIVGGDFYWSEKYPDDSVVISVGDCTGHGVPGALMAMMSLSHLQALQNQNRGKPALILTELNQKIRAGLQKQRAETLADDGLDMVLVCFYPHQRKIVFSGAKMGVLILRGREILNYKGDSKSLGYRRTRDDFSYTQTEVDLQQGDRIVLASDGLIDQNGGPKDYPWGKKALFEALLESSHLKLEEQAQHLEKALMQYQGVNSQRDDITVLAWEIL